MNKLDEILEQLKAKYGDAWGKVAGEAERRIEKRRRQLLAKTFSSMIITEGDLRKTCWPNDLREARRITMSDIDVMKKIVGAIKDRRYSDAAIMIREYNPHRWVIPREVELALQARGGLSGSLDLYFQRVYEGIANLGDSTAASSYIQEEKGTFSHGIGGLGTFSSPSVAIRIRLCIFDLDQTLASTSDLEAFRGHANVGLVDVSTAVAEIHARIGNVEERRLISQQFVQRLGTGDNRIRVGVFTRSPRHYAQAILQLLYPFIEWESIVTYEDVVSRKPNGEGIRRIMHQCRIDDPREVVMVGDDKADLLAAYNVGCYAILYTGGWRGSRKRQQYDALGCIPDGIAPNEEVLERTLHDLDSALPELDYGASRTDARYRGHIRFDRINYFYPGKGSRFIRVEVAGKVFSKFRFLQESCIRHGLTQQILDHKDAISFPPAWVNAIRAWIFQKLHGNGETLVVTVVPFKPGRTPRLEILLRQVEQSFEDKPMKSNKGLVFDPKLLFYAHGAAQFHRQHLGAEDRFANAMSHLRVSPGINLTGKRVAIIDDVVTSGSTLQVAYDLLQEAGAIRIECLALAKAISDR